MRGARPCGAASVVARASARRLVKRSRSSAPGRSVEHVAGRRRPQHGPVAARAPCAARRRRPGAPSGRSPAATRPRGRRSAARSGRRGWRSGAAARGPRAACAARGRARRRRAAPRAVRAGGSEARSLRRSLAVFKRHFRRSAHGGRVALTHATGGTAMTRSIRLLLLAAALARAGCSRVAERPARRCELVSIDRRRRLAFEPDDGRRRRLGLARPRTVSRGSTGETGAVVARIEPGGAVIGSRPASAPSGRSTSSATGCCASTRTRTRSRARLASAGCRTASPSATARCGCRTSSTRRSPGSIRRPAA